MNKYQLDAGRCIVTPMGYPFATIHGVGHYDPCKLDEFAHDIVNALNDRTMIADLSQALREFCQVWDEYGEPDNKAVNDAWLKARAVLAKYPLDSISA